MINPDILRYSQYTPRTEGNYERVARTPRFSPVDPRFEGVSASLSALPREDRLWINGLFAEPLTAHRDEIIAVRSYDIVTVLNDLSRGASIVDYPEPSHQIMPKPPGWFYMTPIYTHPFYDEHPDLRNIQHQENFTQIVGRNAENYGSHLSFSTAFALSVDPLLGKGWRQSLPTILNEPRDHASNFEDFTAKLRFELLQMKAKEGDMSHKKLPYMNELTKMLPNGTDPTVILSFLTEIAMTRGGVVVGFNRNVLQGRCESDATKDRQRITHGARELVVHPESGEIALRDAIVAIEPQGNYEDEIVEQLNTLLEEETEEFAYDSSVETIFSDNDIVTFPRSINKRDYVRNGYDDFE